MVFPFNLCRLWFDVRGDHGYLWHGDHAFKNAMEPRFLKPKLQSIKSVIKNRCSGTNTINKHLLRDNILLLFELGKQGF